MFALAPTRRARAAIAALALAFLALAALVAAGVFTSLDQFSLDHLMPWLVPGSPAGSATAGFYRPFTLHSATAIKILDLWTYPCSVLVSGLVVGVACLVLWRRLGTVAALAPAAAWVIGNAVEVVGKHVIVRPAVYGTANGVRIHVTAFDDSFPSGHMLRGVLVAGAIVLVWKRAAPWALFWVVLVGPALVLQAAHTITDVVGGAIVGVMLLVPVFALVHAPEPSTR
jgi:membrane-associated phospholipid phosphatase